MSTLLDIAAIDAPLADTIADQLEQVAITFERQLASDLSPVNTLCLHIEHYRGKMLRPTLVIVAGLAAGADSTPPTEAHRTIAAVVEMIHMATLVHDDILDDADIRRRGQTINALRGNETAVMLGDYLISNAFHLCSSLNEPALNLALGAVTNTLCEGELIQLHNRDNLSLDREGYIEIIRRKTASLIAECARLGAQISGADTAVCKALHTYGESLGIAFQMQDDLLDLIGDQRVVGKSLGRDLAKGKITLPIIHALRTGDAAQRATIIDLVEQRDAPALRTLLLDSGSVDATREAARDHVRTAIATLPTLPDTPARTLLSAMADAVVARDF